MAYLVGILAALAVAFSLAALSVVGGVALRRILPPSHPWQSGLRNPKLVRAARYILERAEPICVLAVAVLFLVVGLVYS